MTDQICITHTICDNCRKRIDSTKWRPPPGLDPDMREFACLQCKRSFYKVAPGATRLEREKESRISSEWR